MVAQRPLPPTTEQRLLPQGHHVDEHPWPRGLRPGHVDHALVVVSDVEMGAGGAEDDFPQSDYLGSLLAAYNRGPFADVPVTAVFNGDTFDLLKTSYLGGYPTRITADVAVGKLTRVAAAHPRFFEHLRRFVRGGAAERQVAFLTGNHDLELLFPEVQQHLRGLCGVGDAVSFPGHDLRIGEVQIEHGFRADPLFRVDEDAPFVEHDGETLLNLPWGTVALLEVAMPMLPMFYALDRLKPRQRVLDEVPELRELLLDAYWHYWTRDYWRDYFAESDPLKTVSWTMLKEIVYRFGTRHADVSMGDHYQRLLKDSETLRLYLVGHQHEPGWWSWGDRKVLRTGCFRNEFMLRDEGAELLPKVYAEVYLREDRVVRSHLVEVDAPLPPEGYLPSSLDALRPEAQRLLEQRDHERERAERAKQEALEAQRSKGLATSEEAGLPFLRTLRQALSGARKPPED